MSDTATVLTMLESAIREGRTVTIKADELKVESGEVTASGLEITVE